MNGTEYAFKHKTELGYLTGLSIEDCKFIHCKQMHLESSSKQAGCFFVELAVTKIFFVQKPTKQQIQVFDLDQDIIRSESLVICYLLQTQSRSHHSLFILYVQGKKFQQRIYMNSANIASSMCGSMTLMEYQQVLKSFGMKKDCPSISLSYGQL